MCEGNIHADRSDVYYKKRYFFSPSALTSALYRFSLFFLRYPRCERRSETICKSPRRECLSLGCFFRCEASSSMRRVRIATCASGDPVSSSCCCTFFIAFCFFRFVSMWRNYSILTCHLQVYGSVESPNPTRHQFSFPLPAPTSYCYIVRH